MPDRAFAVPQLAQIYDVLDSDRSDLDHYVAIVQELGASSVLDVGCGTGTFACLLAGLGTRAIGVDPAQASLDVAAAKPYADRVEWLLGDATTLPALSVDLAVMTGNVAQVFTTDDAWHGTLSGIRAALSPSTASHLVFETRDPDRRGWEHWTRENSLARTETPEFGAVETWVELTDVSLPLVSFRWTYRFAKSGETLTSDSTLRFRDRTEIESSLDSAGFAVRDLREAPDRPGMEMVFIAGRA